jgi:hypothetical protein
VQRDGKVLQHGAQPGRGGDGAGQVGEVGADPGELGVDPAGRTAACWPAGVPCLVQVLEIIQPGDVLLRFHFGGET